MSRAANFDIKKVDASSANWKLREMRARGATKAAISKAAGIDEKTIHNLLHGNQTLVDVGVRNRIIAAPLPPVPEKGRPWISQAVCVGMDPNLFMVDHQGKAFSAAAREACDRCPVWRDCLEETMADGGSTDLSYRGRMTPNQRRDWRQKQKKLRAAAVTA